jgi:hypothetical protein
LLGASTVTVEASSPAYQRSTSRVTVPSSIDVTVPSKAVSKVARISAAGIAHLAVVDPSAVRARVSSPEGLEVSLAAGSAGVAVSSPDPQPATAMARTAARPGSRQ